ncbi:unnamed protein product [Darwinula stevensoni]|uniref:C2H2-type domain-containing protein n=1 Tax=Darwinula stevensoni TaxID=69355 RepID=A0A7R8XCT9_9CRUS|nr:unnamed protein product [Darwinula stevensoni]CAG0889159.1 unnamed protein product [Darwinula stevensoni]
MLCSICQTKELSAPLVSNVTCSTPNQSQCVSVTVKDILHQHGSLDDSVTAIESRSCAECVVLLQKIHETFLLLCYLKKQLWEKIKAGMLVDPIVPQQPPQSVADQEAQNEMPLQSSTEENEDLDVLKAVGKALCHGGNFQIQCPRPECLKLICSGRKSTLRKNILSHLRTHSDSAFVCDRCGSRSRTRDGLEHHVNKVHLQIQPYECDAGCCSQTFHSRKEQADHRRKRVCPLCQLPCRSPHALKVHMRSHTDERPYECKTCSQSFKRVNDLNRHTETHAEGKVECGECGKLCRDLRAHRKVHSKTHVCRVCSKAFPSQAKLLTHMGQHGRDLKQFMCEVCGVKFAAVEYLKIHLEQHSGWQGLPCPHCTYRTFYRSNLKKHVRQKHRDK